MPHSTAQPVDHAARTYAAALFDLADQQGRLDVVDQQFKDLAQLWRDQPDLQRLLSSRVIGKPERAESIQRLFEGRMDDLLYRFLQVVNSHDRMSHLPTIAEAFDQMMDDKMGRVEVDVYVAQPLDAQQTQQVKQDIREAMGKTAELREHVDPSLIGGLKLRVGDKLIDGSVATQLRQMRHRMKDAAREARTRVVVGEG